MPSSLPSPLTTLPVSDLHTDRHKFLLLDAIRGIAALFIMVRHSIQPLSTLLTFPHSYLAVDLFFCLSGFVIAFSYDHRLSSSLTFQRFALMRVIRLYPLFALGILLGFVFLVGRFYATLHGHGLPTGPLLTLLPNLLFLPAPTTAALFPGDSPGWSLFYELLANLAFAALWRLRRAQSSLLALPVLAALALLLWHTTAQHAALDLGANRSEWLWGTTRVTFSFFLGVLLLRLFQRLVQPSRHPLPPAALALGPLAVLAIVLVLGLRLPSSTVPLYDLLSITLILPAAVFAAACCRLPFTLQPAATFLGDYSYPLYILHVPLFTLIDRLHLVRTTQPLTQLLVSLLLTLGMVLLTWSLGKLYDVPLRKRLSVALWPKPPRPA